MKKLITLCILLLSCASICAQIYSYVDTNGNTIYTDNPPKGQSTRVVDIPNTPSRPSQQSNDSPSVSNNSTTDTNNSTKTIKLSPPGNANFSAIENDSSEHNDADNGEHKPLDTSYTSIKIIMPAPLASIPHQDGQMIIQVKSDPPLRADHKYRFLIDNKNIGEIASPLLSLNNIDRGEHKLKVQIIDKEGKILLESAQQLFYIKQITLADKRRIKPCKYPDYGVRPECPLKDKPPPESILRKTVDLVTNILKNAATKTAEGAIASKLP